MSAIGAAHAGRALGRALARVGRDRIVASGAVSVVAAGKAAVPMAVAFQTWAEQYGLSVKAGLLVAPAPQVALPAPWEVCAGGHPLPNEGSVRGGLRALEIARNVPRDGRLIVLLSGGASALLAAPAGGVTLQQKADATRRLLDAGATVHELSTVRKHLSAIKGGQLAAACDGETVTLAVSDVVGPVEDDLSVIGSGPTVPDASTCKDAVAVIECYGGAEGWSRGLVEVPARHETPKPGDRRLARSRAEVIAGRRTALEGAQREARGLGYVVAVRDVAVTGEARDTAHRHLAWLEASARQIGRPACLLSAGETTVRVTGAGRGGRNQEFALAAADGLQRLGSRAVLTSLGTDGIDGPTDAAGAFVDSTTVVRSREKGLETPEHYLQANDAYRFFEALGDLIITGPTATNVGDLQVALIG